MHLLEICQWIQNSTVGTDLRESQFMFPVIESIHVLGLTASVGLIMVTDLRLIGVIFKHDPPAQIMKQLKPWMIAGFVVMFLSGGMLFWSEAERIYPSWPFRFKMILLFLAGLNAFYFETTLGRSAETWGDKIPPRARLVGWISLICWAGVILFGRWTAYGLSS